ncbi:MAG: threonine--tRNA ligase [Chloroflexi bacterium]|nr:threonine--tRNA ligase [Chloroflexota bacterium]
MRPFYRHLSIRRGRASSHIIDTLAFGERGRPVSTQVQDPAALKELRHRIRHSAAHIMADAVVELFPEAKLTIGPATDEGFYYDIELPRPLTPEDLERIEARMRDIVKASTPFECKEISRDEAKAKFSANSFKLELIEDIPAAEKITTYSHGKFVDLCEGPHVQRTSDVKAFKLLNVAGSYWRGDETKPTLQRIYGTAFESKEALDQHLKMLEEAARRDHRKLGRELELFMFDPVAPASPFFLPKGATVYNLLVEYIRDLYRRYGYTEVITPQIFNADLWRKSGHYDNYKDDMFFVDIDEREFGVKPMNCPGHALMYGHKLHSYRELPIRYADFARLHRYERSGVTHGLTRVRSFAQDDAHIFCRPDQVEQEIGNFMEMVTETYRIFGFSEPRINLSLRPEKRVGDDALWDKAEKALAAALDAKGVQYTPKPGEGAFYGPKIDFMVQDAIGREWQLSTCQLDFNLPNRFNLEYIAEDNSAQRPVVVHRAVLGSIERFIAVLIEHTAGALPIWLAPVQVALVPIADRHLDFARRVEQQLVAEGFRVNVDGRAERMNLKIREAQLQKVPYMLVVGDREQEQDAVAVRKRTGENLGTQPVAQFILTMRDEVTHKR